MLLKFSIGLIAASRLANTNTTTAEMATISRKYPSTVSGAIVSGADKSTGCSKPACALWMCIDPMAVAIASAKTTPIAKPRKDLNRQFRRNLEHCSALP